MASKTLYRHLETTSPVRQRVMGIIFLLLQRVNLGFLCPQRCRRRNHLLWDECQPRNH